MLVECRSDTEYAERPVALHWQGERMEIVEVLTRWRTPESKCFRVRTVNGQIFILAYHETTSEWYIQQP